MWKIPEIIINLGIQIQELDQTPQFIVSSNGFGVLYISTIESTS